MKQIRKLALGAALVLVATAAISTADAACPGAPIVTSTTVTEGYSVLYVEDWTADSTCYTYGCYDRPVAAPQGNFWKLGAGQANQNGPFGIENWITQPNYGGYYFYLPGAFLSTNWNASADIVGCVYNDGQTPDGSCTCVLVTDEKNQTSYFAIMGAAMDALGNTSVVQPGGAPIVLRPLPAPFVENSVRNAGTLNIDALELSVSMPAGGDYTLDGCGCGAVSYRVYSQLLARNDPAPDSRNLGDGWAPAMLQGGGGDPGGHPMGSTTTYESMCGGGETTLWVTAEITFDSGFTGGRVSGNATQIDCGPNLAEPIDRREDRRENRRMNQRRGGRDGR